MQHGTASRGQIPIDRVTLSSNAAFIQKG